MLICDIIKQRCKQLKQEAYNVKVDKLNLSELFKFHYTTECGIFSCASCTETIESNLKSCKEITITTINTCKGVTITSYD